jgi:hypothetical protein
MLRRGIESRKSVNNVFLNGKRGILSKRSVEGGECEQRLGRLGGFIENMKSAGSGFKK